MRKILLPTLLLALTAPALAQTVTITTLLGDRGFAQGFLLSGRQASNFYVPLPAGTDISNVRIGMQGLAVAPNLQRGSVVISVNGQPVDALRLGENPHAQSVELDTVLNEGKAFRAPALDLRFRADLLADAELCADEFDPANSLQVLPGTMIRYDVDLDAVVTLGDALALLPGQPVLVMPLPLTPATSAAALKLSTVLASRGYRASLAAQADPQAVASLRLVTASASGAITLEHDAGKLAILVPENADIAAFERLWQFAAGALDANTLKAEAPLGDPTANAPSFWSFPVLPAQKRVAQTGDLGLAFPMLGGNGLSAGQLKLRLMVAPDWSNTKPAITVYLNGQLIAATRAEIGENLLNFTLPADLLLLSNQLSVTVDRAQVEGYCAGANPGHVVQLLPGTGIFYDGAATSGFALMAHALRQSGTVLLPEAAKGSVGLGYLTLAARVLSGLGAGPAPLAVAFGDSTVAPGPVLSIAPAGPNGLILPIGTPELTLSSDQPLASVSADPLQQKLDILVSDAENPPNPQTILLGNSGQALLGSEGVIWQDTPTRADPSLGQRVVNGWQGAIDLLRSGGLIWVLLLASAIVLIVLARALINSNTKRKSSK